MIRIASEIWHTVCELARVFALPAVAFVVIMAFIWISAHMESAAFCARIC